MTFTFDHEQKTFPEAIGTSKKELEDTIEKIFELASPPASISVENFLQFSKEELALLAALLLLDAVKQEHNNSHLNF